MSILVVDVLTRCVLLHSVYNLKPTQINVQGSLIRELMLNDGLVSLFNGISTFLGYLMPKPFS